ncbi:hypothetical protein D3C76_1835560 [compost metagenome]
MQPQQRAADGGFPTAGLAHQAENRAFSNAETDVIHRSQLPGSPAEQAFPQRKMLLQTFDFH